MAGGWQERLAPTARCLGLGLRSEDPEQDGEFLDRLYATTRVEELAQTGWSEPEVRRFLHEQSRLQRAHYREHYPDAEFLLIAGETEPVGRLYLDERPGELRLMDIAFLPAWRGAGRGTALIEALQRLAGEEGLAVTLHVEPFNPAIRLYRRMGFEALETRGVYQFMRWEA
ncbi:GNAT family N-acetyltransferase [Wenzhouxiangella sediminis]|uniref:GNAT family N-acetyltransferase n=1 Tax=Wenzhouxiangella sediminis TaxID=1792836 RepID=A0A3E1K8W4_9GAMM|nr:GNAT family N-acetyltransferase [Wenzhouxiangella sediminis]RFF30545.1 GNAT family N-acetyltransferase [Wenzhouxiangella sediminis]